MESAQGWRNTRNSNLPKRKGDAASVSLQPLSCHFRKQSLRSCYLVTDRMRLNEILGVPLGDRHENPYDGRRLENRYIDSATPALPMISNTTLVAGDCVLVDAIANAARPILSANTSLTTRITVKPLSVAR